MKEVDLGIVLSRKSYSETSLIVTILTKEKGLKTFIYKGGKKKGQHIFPLCLAEITHYSRKESELLHLTDVSQIKSWSFQFDPTRSALAFYCCELLYQCIKSENIEKELFSYLEKIIGEIDSSPVDPLFPLIFSIELTKLLGFGPLTDEKNYNYFDLSQGAFTSSIEEGDHYCQKKSPSIEVIFNLAKGLKPQDQITKSTRRQSLKTMLDYYRIHIPGFKELKSLAVLETVLND